MKEFIGRRLSQARQWRGYSLEYLAGKLDLTKASISLYEKGARQPDTKIQLNIASVLNFPMPFFYKELSSVPLPAISFRKKANTKKHQKQRAELYRDFSFELLNFLEGSIDFKSTTIPLYDNDVFNIETSSIEQIALDVRKETGLGLGPIPDLSIFIENRGVFIFDFHNDLATVDGFSSLVGNRPYVFINKDFSWDRIRFTLAHELGHIILHSGVTDSDWESSENQKLFEIQANKFASAFLFPKASFEVEFINTNQRALLVLKEKWGMSMAALVYRAKDLSLITESQYSYFFEQLSRNGSRVIEEGSLLRKKEQPYLIKTALDAVINQASFGIDQIKQEVPLTDDLLEKLTFGKVCQQKNEERILQFRIK